MKKYLFSFVMLLAVQVAKADEVIASYTFPNQHLANSGTYTGTISETLGTASGCTVYCKQIGGYQSNGTTPNSTVLSGTTYFQKFAGNSSYVTITLTGGGKIHEGDVFKATLYSGSGSTDGFYFKEAKTEENDSTYITVKYNSTAAVTLEYQLHKKDINEDGSLTLYRYGGACYVNTFTIERASGVQVDYLNTNLNDETWGDIKTENPTSGDFGFSVRNGFTFTNAVMRNGSVDLTGSTGLSDNTIRFTNRILVDKNTTSYVITPYVANCKKLWIVANSGSADKSFNVYKQVGTGLWTSVATPQPCSNTAALYSYSINSDSPVRFKIENNTTSSLFIPYIGTDPNTFPLTITSVGYATFSSAGQYQVSDEVEIYTISSSSESSVTLSKVDGKIIPAKKGVILYKSGGGDITLEYNSESAPNLGTNLLLPNIVATTLSATTVGNTNYILVPGDAGGVMFAPSSGSGTLAANRAYLQLPTPADPAREYVLSFNDDELTGIKAVESSKEKGADVYYDLSGRRVAQPTKGLYIMNGKKYIVK